MQYIAIISVLAALIVMIDIFYEFYKAILSRAKESAMIKEEEFKNILESYSTENFEYENLEIEISKSDYYKSIFCEIELFYTKLLIHYKDFKNFSTAFLSA